MSDLIDDLLGYATVNQEIDGKWYIAKPCDGFLCIRDIITRLKDAWRVLTGKSRAYHFYEDTLKKRPKVIRGKEV